MLLLFHHTLHIELAHPTPYFLQLLAHPLFSPVHRLLDQECPQWPYQSGQNYLCNGPFQLKLNQPNQGYHLIKNPFHKASSLITLDEIILTSMDPFQALQAFEKGEVDWLGNPFGVWHPIYAARKRDAFVSDHNWTCWGVFNTQSAPFHHQKLRHAFALAIDRSDLVRHSPLSITPAYSFFPPRDTEQERHLFSDFNPEKADRLLQEALDELNLSREDLTIDLIFHKKAMQQEHTALILKRQLKEFLGIECCLYPSLWDSFFQRITAGKFQMGLMHWISRVDDPIYNLNAFRFANEGINFSKWEDVEFQRLLNQSEEAINPFQRSSCLLRAEEILSQEMPTIPLYHQPSQAIIRSEFYTKYKISRGYFNIARDFFKQKESLCQPY